MRDYNGFSPRERQLAWDLQKAYKADGLMSWEGEACCMCKQGNMEVMPHLENYFIVTAFTALCVECHMNLHARFKMPTGWLRYLHLLREGYKPYAWPSVGSFFGSRKSKELFNVPKNLPIFDVSGVVDVEWFEELELRPVDLRVKLIKQEGYSETHLQDELKAYRVEKLKENDLILDE